MEDRPASEYCPRCQAVQPTFQFTEELRSVRRCQVCGFPVETGLVLEPAELGGFPRPPEIKILCVDDDPLIVQLIGDILRFHGYTVLSAGDGPSGLDLAARERPSLILLDIMMPGMNGFEVCRRLKLDLGLKDIPVVILTAMGDSDLNVRAFEAGAELALRKPASTATVLRTIEAALALAATRAAGPVPASALEMSSLSAGRRPAEREPEVPLDLSLPTHAVTATFWTVDGAVLEAQLFLHMNAEQHGGPETMQDRLNDPDLFLTLTLPGETSALFLNKIQVIRVDVPLEAQPAEPADNLGDVTVTPIKVQLINGEQLSGTVWIEAPEGRRRLSDFLNTHPAFLPLQGKDRLHLLHKRFIARILPQTA